MADNEEESKENDKNKADKETPEEEKAKKDDANKKMKTDSSQEDNSKKGNDSTQKSPDQSDKTTGEKTENKTGNHTDNSANVEQGAPQNEAKAEELSKTVDLKLVQTHYKTHTKTTLPHILTEYGMEDKEHPDVKKEKKERKKKKKKREESNETDDEDRQRRKAKDEKFRQTFGDSRQTDTYYMEYIDFLEKKVASQRLKAEKQREEEKRLAALKEEEKREQHRLHKRLQRIDLKHDDSFMKELPRTDISRIIALQDKMKREGKLRTQAEVDKFWQDIRKPDIFYNRFKVKQSDPYMGHLNHQDSETNTNENSDVFREPMAPRSLSHISESSKGEKEPWAITQKFQSSHGPKSPVSPRKGSSQLAREAALDLEKRCPKLEMPPLACFSLQLGEKPPDPEEIQKKVELKLREKNRKKTQRKVQRMYQMAMTNTAAANRILAQHKDLTTMFEGAALRDVLSVFDEPFMTGMGRQLGTQPLSVAQPHQGAMELYPGAMMQASPPSQASSRQTSASSIGSRKLTPLTDSRPTSMARKPKTPLQAIEYPAPAPLSFNEVLTREKTVEPKCLSTMWTNYMHAGKSVFAQT